jgi:RND superfamily putative drug exporter
VVVPIRVGSQGSDAATPAVEQIRAIARGGSAINLDAQRAARHDRNLVVPGVLVVVVVILAVVLRAVVAPLLLAATVVLSFAATLGVSALAFNNVFHFAGSDPAIPLFAFVFLVALGVDYNIFLMTRVHEESRRRGTRRGALIGLAATGGVITSAGLVLAGTFAALGSLPVVLATEIGLVVAFGVLLDTFVVRSVLVSALNLDVGRWLWWPSGLHRRPDVDLGELEGDQTAALTT